MTIKSFENLDCWKMSTELRRKCSKLVKTFPADEKYKLVDQILRASRSVTANIAEGFGRYHYQEYVQYCRQSRGSLYELIDHFIVARDEGYISEEEFANIKNLIKNSLGLLNGFIKYLTSAKQNNSAVSEAEFNYDIHTTQNDETNN